MKSKQNYQFVSSLFLILMGIIFIGFPVKGQAERAIINWNYDEQTVPETVVVGDTGKVEYKFSPVADIPITGELKFTSNEPALLNFSADGRWQALKPGKTSFYSEANLSDASMKAILEKYSGIAIPETPTVSLVTVLPYSEAVYRLYNPNSGEHFFTKSTTEKDQLTQAGWQYEAISWQSYTRGVPVYRVYNPNAGDHHYTTNLAEVKMLVAAGWHDEGISFNAANDKKQATYRLYNPNAKSGAHHYTMSIGERDALVNDGWQSEGIAWYGE